MTEETPEIILMLIGNSLGNGVWEATVPVQALQIAETFNIILCTHKLRYQNECTICHATWDGEKWTGGNDCDWS